MTSLKDILVGADKTKGREGTQLSAIEEARAAVTSMEQTVHAMETWNPYGEQKNSLVNGPVELIDGRRPFRDEKLYWYKGRSLIWKKEDSTYVYIYVSCSNGKDVVYVGKWKKKPNLRESQYAGIRFYGDAIVVLSKAYYKGDRWYMWASSYLPTASGDRTTQGSRGSMTYYKAMSKIIGYSLAHGVIYYGYSGSDNYIRCSASSLANRHNGVYTYSRAVNDSNDNWLFLYESRRKEFRRLSGSSSSASAVVYKHPGFPAGMLCYGLENIGERAVFIGHQNGRYHHYLRDAKEPFLISGKRESFDSYLDQYCTTESTNFYYGNCLTGENDKRTNDNGPINTSASLEVVNGKVQSLILFSYPLRNYYRLNFGVFGVSVIPSSPFSGVNIGDKAACITVDDGKLLGVMGDKETELMDEDGNFTAHGGVMEHVEE